MKITAEKFVELLRSSSLSAEEQEEVLKMLPKLDEKKLDQLVAILTEDSENVKGIMSEMEEKMEGEVEKLNADLEQDNFDEK